MRPPFTMACVLVSQQACDRSNSWISVLTIGLHNPHHIDPGWVSIPLATPSFSLAKSATARYVQPHLLGLHPYEKLGLPSTESRRMRTRLCSDSNTHRQDGTWAWDTLGKPLLMNTSSGLYPHSWLLDICVH